MSVIGTGTAAAVAQTALQAQQVARRRDRAKTDSAGDAKRIRETIEAHLQALEEGDETETPAQLHIGGELPEHQTPPQSVETIQQRPDDADAPADDAVDPPTGTPMDAPPPLYRHLDIQA